jgi:hypothetical protein
MSYKRMGDKCAFVMSTVQSILIDVPAPTDAGGIMPVVVGRVDSVGIDGVGVVTGRLAISSIG